MIGTALVRVRKVEATIGVAHDIVGAVQAPPLVALDQHFHGAIGAGACDLAAVAFAYNQPAVEIERGAVAPLREAYCFRRAAQGEAMQLIDAQIDEIPIIIRVPQRAFGKGKAGGNAFRGGRVQHVGQIVCGRHGVLLESREPGAGTDAVDQGSFAGESRQGDWGTSRACERKRSWGREVATAPVSPRTRQRAAGSCRQ